MLLVSFALAAVGILTCIAALLDAIVPKGSVWALAAVVAVVIALVMVAYVWVCDKCEDCLSGRFDWLRRMKRQTPRGATNKGK